MEDAFTALWSLSFAQAASGQYDEAAKGYQQCLQILPPSRDAHTLERYRRIVFHLAVVWNHLGRFGEAVESAEKGLLLGPTPYGRALGLAAKGEGLYGLGRPAEGAAAFEQALKLNGTIGRLRVADAMVRLAIDDMLDRAEKLLHKEFSQREEEAERQTILDKIRVRQDQNRTEALSLVAKGEALYGLGRPAEGAAAFEQALKLNSTVGRLRVADAMVRLAIDDMLDRAEKLLHKEFSQREEEAERQTILDKIRVRQDQNRTEALSLVAKGEALYGLGRPAEGAAAFEQALKLNSTVGRLRVADAMVRLAMDDMLDRAEKLLSEQFRCRSEEGLEKRILLGKIYVRQGRNKLKARTLLYLGSGDWWLECSPGANAEVSKLLLDAKAELSKLSLTVPEMQEYIVDYAISPNDVQAVLDALNVADRKWPLIARLKKDEFGPGRELEIDFGLALPHLLAISDEDCIAVIRKSFFAREVLDPGLLSVIAARRDARWLPDLIRFLSLAASARKWQEREAYEIAVRGILEILTERQTSTISDEQLRQVTKLSDIQIVRIIGSETVWSSGYDDYINADVYEKVTISLSKVRDAASRELRRAPPVPNG